MMGADGGVDAEAGGAVDVSERPGHVSKLAPADESPPDGFPGGGGPSGGAPGTIGAIAIAYPDPLSSAAAGFAGGHSGRALAASHSVVAPLWEDGPQGSMEMKIRLPMNEV
jgi:hypothetical protein